MSLAPIVPVSVVVVALLIVLSAFFSSSETAIFSLSDEWVAGLAGGGDERATVLADLRADPHRLLVTILVGNNVVNVAISSIVTAALVLYLPTGLAVTLATMVGSVVVLVFGEIVPKSYGLGNASQWALRVAGPLRSIERALGPLVTLFDGITRRINVRLGGDLGIEGAYLDE